MQQMKRGETYSTLDSKSPVVAELMDEEDMIVAEG